MFDLTTREMTLFAEPRPAGRHKGGGGGVILEPRCRGGQLFFPWGHMRNRKYFGGQDQKA